jgi:DNA-binding beta-propeller fold protein YncE
LTLRPNGSIFVADSTANYIWRLPQDGSAGYAFVGNGTQGTSPSGGVGYGDTKFNKPRGIASTTVYNNTTLIIADTNSHQIMYTGWPYSNVYMAAGTGTGVVGYLNGNGSIAKFYAPCHIAFNPNNGQLYVADSGNNVIRAIDIGTNFNGTFNTTTFAGGMPTLIWRRSNGPFGTMVQEGAAATGYLDTVTQTQFAQFNNPQGVAVDSNNIVYVADTGNHCIRKISAGITTTLAGNGTAGWLDGTGTAARFQSPTGVAVDSYNNVYVADKGNNYIRIISPNGVVKTLSNGSGTPITFNGPYGLTVDSAGVRSIPGTIFITEYDGNTIQMAQPNSGVACT